eukprot:scaffold75811_cov20-Tisochrysis_lutea.AAC.1
MKLHQNDDRAVVCRQHLSCMQVLKGSWLSGSRQWSCMNVLIELCLQAAMELHAAQEELVR